MLAHLGIDGECWQFDLPQTHPVSLNHRMAWQQKHRITKPYRDAAHVLARAVKIPHCRRVRVYLIYTPRDARRRDPLNLIATLKLVEDGIVDAGVVDDDNPDFIESQMPLIDLPEKGKAGRLTVLVERVL